MAHRSWGLAHFRQGHIADALDIYRRGLEFAERSKDKKVLSDLLRGVGVTERASGHFDAALAATERSMALTREIGDMRTAALMLSNIAVIYGDMGDVKKKAEILEEQLRFGQANNILEAVTSAYDNLAVVYMGQGDVEIALDYFEKNLTLKRETGADNREISLTMINLEIAHRALGRYDLAVEDLNTTLQMARAEGDIRRIATVLNNRSQLHRERGNVAQAIADATEAHELLERGGVQRDANEALVSLAMAHLSAGHYTEALDLARRVGAFARASNAPNLLWISLEPAGQAALKLGLRDEARKAFVDEVGVLEGLRRGVIGAELEGSGFFTDKMNPYRGLVALDVEDGRIEEALRTSEQAKARQLYDIVKNGHIDAPKAKSADEKTLQHAGFEAVSLADAATLVPDDATAFIAFAVTADRTFAFVLTRGAGGAPSLTVETIAWPAAALAREVDRFREALSARDLGYRAPAGALYKRLFAPIASKLRGKRVVGIVPDGPLWGLPFQALVGPGGRHVIEDHAVFYAPSLTTLHETRRLASQQRSAPRALLAVGAAGEPALPEAAREVHELHALYGADSSAEFTGAAAREDRWKEEAPRYRVLHVATHGVLNSASPFRSYLALSGDAASGSDGRLEAREILGLTLDADIAVLSACETARGRVTDGEGVLGMSWAFLVAGSPTTVVSAWKVDSAATRQLMVAFHRGLLTRQSLSGSGRARALQEAAVRVMQTATFRHPFYWAAFSMIGEGR